MLNYSQEFWLRARNILRHILLPNCGCRNLQRVFQITVCIWYMVYGLWYTERVVGHGKPVEPGAVAQARAATRQLLASAPARWSLLQFFALCNMLRDMAAAAAAAAAPSLMMVAPIAFCKCFVGSSRKCAPLFPHASVRLACCPAYSRFFIYRLMAAFIALCVRLQHVFVALPKEKCNSHSNWTCTFMAFSFSSHFPVLRQPPHPLPLALSFPSLSFARVRHTKPQENAKEKPLVIVSVCACVCVCRLPPIFRRRVSKKTFPSTQAEAYELRGTEKQQGSNTLMEFVPGSLSRGLVVKKRQVESINVLKRN